MIKFYKLIDTSDYYSNYTIFQSTRKEECIKYYKQIILKGLLDFYYEWWKAQRGYDEHFNDDYILEDYHSDEWLDMGATDFNICLNFVIMKELWYELNVYDMDEYVLEIDCIFETLEEHNLEENKNIKRHKDRYRSKIDLKKELMETYKKLDEDKLNRLCEEYYGLVERDLIDVGFVDYTEQYRV